MTLPLDHIVIAVQDLERTIADYTALGFNVLRGGEHPGRSTHNALVVFADGAYFELIAWRAPAPEERWWRQLQRHGEGIVDFALLPTETGAVVAAAQARGLDYEAPYEGGRLRPDGAQLRWRNARARSQDLPFLCGDLTPRALRVPEGDARVHANGATGVARLHVAVHDLRASLALARAAGRGRRHRRGPPVGRWRRLPRLAEAAGHGAGRHRAGAVCPSPGRGHGRPGPPAGHARRRPLCDRAGRAAACACTGTGRGRHAWRAHRARPGFPAPETAAA